MNRKTAPLLIILVVLFGLAMMSVMRPPRRPPVAEYAGQAPAPSVTPSTELELEKTREEMMRQLQGKETSGRQLALPLPPNPLPLPEVPVAPPLDERALGRKKRAGLPMGVVLWDDVQVFESAQGKKEIFRMMTGDMVRVFPDDTPDMARVQPGLDVYLAATTKETKPAGERLPDRDGWVKKSDIRLFEPDDAKEYIMEVSPVTLGNDPAFSTLGFYERAMKNPDPVVHRVVSPRLIALVQLHEDYSSSWSKLYRDRDQKIRDAALSSLNERGVANNRQLIEDLIVRLIELTKTRAQGETALEVLSILNVLKNSGHPRVPAALASFEESWKQTQNDDLNKALGEILSR